MNKDNGCNGIGHEKELFKQRIKNAVKIASQQLIQQKKALGQKLVISENGKIKTIDP